MFMTLMCSNCEPSKMEEMINKLDNFLTRLTGNPYLGLRAFFVIF